VIVEEGNLTNVISLLRKALGESSEAKYIETVPKRGYRFVAEVREVREHGAPPEGMKGGTPAVDATPIAEARSAPALPRYGWLGRKMLAPLGLLIGLIAVAIYIGIIKASPPVASRGMAVPSIAVLPFKRLGADPDHEYLGLAMADALITQLTNIRQIIVRPTRSIQKYTGSEPDPRAAGRELSVDALLDGTIQRSQDRLRVTVQLIRVRDGTPLWASTFDTPVTDLFAAQDAIAQPLTRALQLTLTGEEQQRLAKRYTENSEAYQLYMMGRFHFWERETKEGVETALRYFEQAIEKDPHFALAYTGLADSYSAGWFFMNPATPARAVMPKAKAAALKALALDDQLAEAHTALAVVRFRYDWDWAGAASEFQRALALSPNHAIANRQYAGYLAAVGRLDDAIATAQRARQIDPLSLTTNLGLAWILHVARQYDRAIAQYREVLRLDPNFAIAHQWLASTFEDKGMYEEAIAHRAKADALRGESPEKAAALTALRTAGIRGYWQKRLDLALEQAKQRYVPSNHIANLYAHLGEKDQAFAWLEKAYEERPPDMVMLKVSPKWDGLDMRSDPRFGKLLRRMGLSP